MADVHFYESPDHGWRAVGGVADFDVRYLLTQAGFRPGRDFATLYLPAGPSAKSTRRQLNRVIQALEYEGYSVSRFPLDPVSGEVAGHAKAARDALIQLTERTRDIPPASNSVAIDAGLVLDDVLGQVIDSDTGAMSQLVRLLRSSATALQETGDPWYADLADQFTAAADGLADQWDRLRDLTDQIIDEPPVSAPRHDARADAARTTSTAAPRWPATGAVEAASAGRHRAPGPHGPTR